MGDTISEQIFNILRETHATNKELSQELDIGENIIRVIVNRMAKYGVVKHTGRFINRYKVYRLVRPEEEKLTFDTQILKKLLVKFIELEVRLEDTTENEDKRIVELIKECQLI